MINVTPATPSLIRLYNAYLVHPDDGSLTSDTCSVWVSQDSGRIVHIAYDDDDIDAPYFDRPSLTPFFPPNSSGSANPPDLDASDNIDLHQSILSPGMIDVQINGCFGVDFSEWRTVDCLGRTAEETYLDGLEHAATKLARTGVTSFVPTIISQTASSYQTIIPVITGAVRSRLPGILGYHLEGPFISSHKPGCHPQENLTEAAGGWDKILATYGSVGAGQREGESISHEDEAEDIVKLITVAPELDGVMDSIKRLKDDGFVVSIGHSTATTSQAVDAVNRGATMITHLFNAMPQLHHREPGILGLLGLSESHDTHGKRSSMHTSQLVRSVAATPRRSRSPTSHKPTIRTTSGSSSDESRSAPTRSPISALQHKQAQSSLLRLETAQFGARSEGRVDQKKPFWSIISDGVHVHPLAINLAYRSHPDGCVLITDAVQLMDPSLPDGLYPWRSPEHCIQKSGDAITLSGTDTLAGASVTLDKCVRNFSKFCSIPLSKAIHHATRTPAKALGPKMEARKGAVRVGWDADLCVWDRFSGEVLATWVGGKEVYNVQLCTPIER